MPVGGRGVACPPLKLHTTPATPLSHTTHDTHIHTKQNLKDFIKSTLLEMKGGEGDGGKGGGGGGGGGGGVDDEDESTVEGGKGGGKKRRGTGREIAMLRVGSGLVWRDGLCLGVCV